MTEGPKRIRTLVYLAGREEPLAAWIDNRDFVRYDQTAKLQGWARPADAQFLFQTYCAWSALQRAQALNGMDFDTFARLATQVVEGGEEEVKPFQEADMGTPDN